MCAAKFNSCLEKDIRFSEVTHTQTRSTRDIDKYHVTWYFSLFFKPENTVPFLPLTDPISLLTLAGTSITVPTVSKFSFCRHSRQAIQNARLVFRNYSTINTLKRFVKGNAKASSTSLISVHNSFDLNSWRYLISEKKKYTKNRIVFS